ncbi:MAG: FAD-dependent oxidoreductase [Firmicutes bacterium]|nr:FAD-dependent oxidoreductase [Bacillota bacterium]
MIRECDVLVVGGGPAGIGASVASARLGKKVILVERYGFLGGWSTVALVAPMMTFHSGSRQVIAGIGDELIQRLRKYDASPGHIPDPIGFTSTVTPFHPEFIKIEAEQMLLESGVTILYHSLVTEVVKGEEELVAVHGYSKSGQFTIKAKAFVDCTGDGDLICFAGFPYKSGREDGTPQPASLIFRVGNVDFGAVRTYMNDHPDQFVLDRKTDSVDGFSALAVSGFFKLVEEAAQKGDFSVPRDRVLLFSGVIPGEVTVNMTRLPSVDVENWEDWSRAEIQGRQQVLQTFQFLKKYIPGFADSNLIQVATQVGLRETRRAVGEYYLTTKDILAGTLSPDRIGLGAFPIDIHSPDDAGLEFYDNKHPYGIPYGCLVPKGSRNLWVAGRCISTTHKAHASTRVMPTCFVTGQAAGTAAALAVETGLTATEIPIDQLQATLKQHGVILD